jgi:hypothetical protein
MKQTIHNQPMLFDAARALSYPNAPAFRNRDTSRDAAEAIAPTAKIISDKVLRLLASGDFTADEAAKRINIDKLAVRPRFSELSRKELIKDSGVRRLNDSGKRAIVWTLK